MSGRGLEGVVAAETAISHVYGEEGRLNYGGYEIEDLAAHASFEEVCHLLWYGELPTSARLDELKTRLADGMTVPRPSTRHLRCKMRCMERVRETGPTSSEFWGPTGLERMTE
jgi:citrate synthase